MSGTYYQGAVLTSYRQETVNTRATKGGNVNFFKQSTATTENLKSGVLKIDLLPAYNETAVPASVNFKLGNKNYFDKGGQIATDLNPTTGESVNVGTIDYSNATATLNAGNWSSVNGLITTLNSLTTTIDGNPVDKVTFRTPTAPIRAGSLNLRATAVDGTKVTATTDYNGNITGTWVTGKADFEYGVADIRFGKLVDVKDDKGVVTGKVWQPLHVFAETITYNADSYTYLPIDSSVVKIDTVRLPPDGRVPIFRRGDSILIRNAKTDDLGSAFTGGQTINLSRKDVDRICLVGSNNKAVSALLWDYDLENGSITFKQSIDLSGYQMPLKAHHAQEQRNRIVDLDIDGTLSLLFPLNRNYPLEDTNVSSLLIGDDLAVRVSVPFTQKAWTKIWQDTPDGEQLLNKLNLKDYPMVLTDDGAITDRWMIENIAGIQFQLFSEALGFVCKFDTLTDLAPINPATGKPYFIIPKQAFGNAAPWGTKDVIRFNTWGTLLPVWVLCAVQPNPNPPTGEDGFEQYLFGDTTEI